MRTKKFNPQEWSKPSEQKENNPKKTVGSNVKVSHAKRNENKSQNVYDQVEDVIHNIESSGIDITANYEDWLKIGFAFADEFRETGRSYFHRVSQYYSGYKSEECDKQYNHCLSSNGQGITIGSFFHLAKENGVLISNPSYRESENNTMIDSPEDDSKIMETTIDQNENLPTFPARVYEDLPEFLKKIVSVATSDQEKDILLLGSITTMSACLPKLYSIYDNKKVNSNLYTFITAQASAGKGILSYSKQLVMSVHKLKREESKLEKQIYDLELAEYNSNKNKNENLEKPIEPSDQMLFIPANNSATGAYQLLGDNNGSGLIFETEGDTLTQAFKSDYGNYSDGFRKAFHHETISYYRRHDKEYVDIERPCLSTLLSGTPKQIPALIPSAENGLLSRFIMYKMKVEAIWKDVFKGDSKNGHDDFINGLADDFFQFYTALNKSNEIQFLFTADQKDKFNAFFNKLQGKYVNLNGLDVLATIRRLGLIATRLCMVISVARVMESREFNDELICEERDFQAILSMIEVLVQHSISVFNELPKEKKLPKRLNHKEEFLYSLPKNFNRKIYLEVAKGVGVKEKTSEGYITSFVKDGLIHRVKQDTYINVSIKDNQDS